MTAMADLPSRPPRGLIPAEQADAWNDGFAFLAAAREKASAIEAATRDEGNQVLAQAMAAGRERGEAEAAERIGRAIADVDAYFAGLSGELADIAFAVVRDVIDQFDRRDIVAMVALKALSAFRRSRTLTVRVHPDHVEAVNETLQEAVRAGGIEIALEVSSDPGMARDGCVLTSDVTTVDAGIDSQIEALRRGLSRRTMPV
ncbi:type III secretion system stator protein SctL [Bosea sp. LjRoot90]|uniref:type III secretion system stator protein SctL n=1 Tax=Bosea sp. LjRoot90 TaxID=3342342 RepID=UPI003ECFFD07